jgi:hypothetical protein
MSSGIQHIKAQDVCFRERPGQVQRPDAGYEPSRRDCGHDTGGAIHLCSAHSVRHNTCGLGESLHRQCRVHPTTRRDPRKVPSVARTPTHSRSFCANKNRAPTICARQAESLDSSSVQTEVRHQVRADRRVGHPKIRGRFPRSISQQVLPKGNGTRRWDGFRLIFDARHACDRLSTAT